MYLQIPERRLAVALLVGFLGVASPRAIAAAFTLSDANSRVDINFTNPLLVETWTVDSLTITGESALWYGYNHPGAPNSFTSSQQTAPNRLEITWYFLGLGAAATYLLNGGGAGSGEATLTESFSVFNGFPGATPFKTYSYNRYDLSDGAASGDRAIMLDQSSLLQTGSLASLAVSTNVRPAHYAIGDPEALLAQVSETPESGTPMNLSDTPPIGVAFPVQPGNPAFAFQWNPSLGPFESQTISMVTKHLKVNRFESVPEPGSAFLLLTSCLTGLGFMLRGRLRHADQS